MSAEERQRGRLSRVIAPSEDYSLRVGVRKATGNVAANAVVSAAPATLLITMLRYNGLDWWPIEADPAATATIMTMLAGIPRFVGDWHRVNVLNPQYRAQQAAQSASPEGD